MLKPKNFLCSQPFKIRSHGKLNGRLGQSTHAKNCYLCQQALNPFNKISRPKRRIVYRARHSQTFKIRSDWILNDQLGYIGQSSHDLKTLDTKSPILNCILPFLIFVSNVNHLIVH